MIFILTSDVDFVSDDFLKLAYEPLKDLPLTIFMTGKSNFLDSELSKNPLWEGEPHPNFCDGSTHGNTLNEVFESMKQFSKEGLGFRCHKYFSSNDIEEELFLRGFLYSSNICTDLESIPPFYDRCGILQIPIFFEDGGYLKYHGVPKIENVIKKMKNDGLYVFNFHPIHLALNSCDFSAIRHLKDSMTSKEYSSLTKKDAIKFRNNSYGMYDFLNELITYARKNNIEFMNLKQCYEKYKVNRI